MKHAKHGRECFQDQKSIQSSGGFSFAAGQHAMPVGTTYTYTYMYIYIYIYLFIYASISIHIYIYIHYGCVHAHMYIYIDIQRPQMSGSVQERPQWMCTCRDPLHHLVLHSFLQHFKNRPLLALDPGGRLVASAGGL